MVDKTMKIDELYIGRQLTKQDHRGMDKTKSPENGKEIKSIDSPITQPGSDDEQPIDPNQVTAVRKEITTIADPAFKGTSLAGLLNNMALNKETSDEPQGSQGSVPPVASGTKVSGEVDDDGNITLVDPGDSSGEEVFVPAALVKAQNPYENLQILAGIKK
jgi:hypothetical protein